MGDKGYDTVRMRTDTSLGAFVFDGYKCDENGNIINESPTLRRQRKNGKNYVKKKKIRETTD